MNQNFASRAVRSLSEQEAPPLLLDISHDIGKAGGESYLVGGWVRDALLGIPSHDFDVEVYGLDFPALQNILERYGKPNLVGKAFGVLTMRREKNVYDFAFPRTESKTGAGHKGFAVKPDPGLSFEKASLRRDFTINAMGVKLPSLELADPHGGLKDLEAGRLRHVSEAFSEDPLRALRAVQFAARFELDIHPETRALCAAQPLEELPRERLFEEFKKLLLKARRPSLGMEWLRTMKLLRYFPELEALIGVQQDPQWHPEGDVWIHNNMVLDAAAEIRDGDPGLQTEDGEFEKLALMLGALCHDLGKPRCTIFKEERWRSPGHDVGGETPTRSFLGRLTRDQRLVEQVVAFVREHLKPALLYNARHEVKPAAIRRLSLKVDIQKLLRVSRADHFGRTTPDALARQFPAGDWLWEQSKNLDVWDHKPKPWLTGRKLLQMGMTPGPSIGKLIRESFELQLEGEIPDEEAMMAWARERVASQKYPASPD